MPMLGERRKAREIGIKGSNSYEWHACADCGLERWVMVRDGIAMSQRCRPCCNKELGRQRRQHPASKPKSQHYYKRISLKQDAPFFSMADKNGQVLEHRLVMAKYLGRPLLRQEVVHHRNGITVDNAIENLELMPTAGVHAKMIVCANCELRKQVRLLRWQIKEQSEQIRNLTQALFLGRCDAI